MHKVRQKGLEARWEAHSCGTANYHIGDPPDPRTLKNATKNGVKIDHLGRQLKRADLDEYDYVLVADRSNLQNTQRLAEERHLSKVMLIRTFDPLDPESEVPDPYYGAEADFQNVFEILDRTIEEFLLRNHD